MEYTYETESDDLYVKLSPDLVAKTIGVTDRCLVDVDHQGKAVGIEVLAVSAGWPIEDVVTRFGLEQVRPLLNELGHLRPMGGVPSGRPDLTRLLPV